MGTGRAVDRVALEFARLARERLGDRVRAITLFGSRARGDAREHSDYDVVVVVDRRTPDVRAILNDISVEILDRRGALVACLLRDELEWSVARGYPLGMNVAREGIAL
jgi:predicted nucleotidyltransferase